MSFESTIFDPTKSLQLKTAYYDFTEKVKIDSKETGVSTLVPYAAQHRFINGIFDGLEAGRHWTVCLKARQLGITTFSLLLDLFWLRYFDGIQGALVADSEGNKEKLRLIITRLLESLPKSHQIPVVLHNRNGLVLANGSTLDYLVAGTKKNSNLGRSRALNYLHATECGFWGSPDGVESLRATLADEFPARLYIWESTAKGFNWFHNLWEEAKSDDLTKNAIFIGWWAKESYSIARGTALFDRYGTDPITEEEQNLIEIVREKYDHEVTLEQLAWYRYRADPARTKSDSENVNDSIIEQEYPWHEEQAFMVTGSHFFPGKQITENIKEASEITYNGYRYFLGENFLLARIEPVRFERQAQLKIFEDPDPNGIYVIGADPAFGMSTNSDRHCLQVLRCYADCVEQVAEFASKDLYAYQFAWVLLHVAGMYQNARYLLELNGPGEAVFTEFKNIRVRLQNGELGPSEKAKHIGHVLRHIKTYMHVRADAIESKANSWHWRTTLSNKLPLMTQLRDEYVQRNLRVRSVATLNEMKTIVQDGTEVSGEGRAKDDRVMALALALRAYIDGERRNLQALGRTKEVEHKKALPYDPREGMKDFSKGIITATLAARANELKLAREMAARARTRWNW